MGSNMRSRVGRLESFRARVDDITLADIVFYSYRRDDEPRDFDLEERIAVSEIGRLVLEAVHARLN